MCISSVRIEEAEAANISPGAVLKSFPISVPTGLGWRPSGLLGVRGEQTHSCRRHDLLWVLVWHPRADPRAEVLFPALWSHHLVGTHAD